MELDINTLIRRRGSVRHKLTCFIKYFGTVEKLFHENNELPEKALLELKLRTDKFEIILSEFDEYQMNIEGLCDEKELPIHYRERSDFTDIYNTNLSAAKYIINKCSSSDVLSNESNSNRSVQSIVQSQQINQSNVKLPPIDLPKFSGDIHNWLEFKDTFESLIHLNDSIGDIQKYHYLRSSLGSDAWKIIQSLEFSSQNYRVAWELLCSRFDNSRILVNSHIKALFSLPCLTKESSDGLRDLLDSVNKHLRALTALELPTEHWDALVIYLVSSRLDKVSACEWEKYKVTGDELPKLNDLRKFLKNRADFLTTLESNQKEVRKGLRNISLLSENSLSKVKCNFCNSSSHSIYRCEDFLKLTIPIRWRRVNELRLCSNCLCKGHFNKTCKLGPCKRCKSRHNSLLHGHQSAISQSIKNSSEEINTSSNHCSSHNGNLNTISQGKKETSDSQIVSLSNHESNNFVLLSTAIIKVYDSFGNAHIARAILDSGSQSCFISQELYDRLQLKGDSINLSIRGINDFTSHLRKRCDISIHSMHHDFASTIRCLVLPRIADNLPMYEFNIDSWKIPSNLPLADPDFNKSRPIDLLLGASLFYDLLLDGKISLGKNMPVLQNTIFGYVISGQIPHSVSNVQCYFTTNQMLHDSLQQFWEIEGVNSVKSDAADDELCEKHFVNNTYRNKDGKFVVRIPLKYPASVLGNSKALALKRLINLENRFKGQSSFKNLYRSFMNEYVSLGHMTLLPLDVLKGECNSFFLPHHGVIKNESLTTRLRVVFDGSAITTSGKSLNDLQFIGPAIQNNIFDILIRFRQHNIVVTSDIQKMYRCILVHPEDRCLQRILWRINPDQSIRAYELNTVTYGTTSAPYLALRCLKQLALDNKVAFPEASLIISRDFYVDDLLTGFETEEQAIINCKELSQILDAASFKLRKWASNSHKVLSHLRNNSDEFSVVCLINNGLTKTLGIQWKCLEDRLSYHLAEFSNVTPLTKRSILSDISKIFDPLGLLSPTIILAKILMQRLWSLKIDWDTVIPSDLRNNWVKLRGQLSQLNNLAIPRHALCQSPVRIELHGFCDASSKAYGANIYMRSIDVQHQSHVHLLCAKTKVAPLQVLTTPRLELCGALLLARLIKSISSALTCNFDLFLWCDSQIVFYWIHSQPGTLQTFVANRVAEIRALTITDNWNYVPSKENPADIASRGLLPNELINSQLWWNGPTFLRASRDHWPKPLQVSSTLKIPELRKPCKALLTTNNNPSIIDKFSSLDKLKRVLAYCLRFLSNARTSKEQRIAGPLSTLELYSSLKHLVKIAQNDDFHHEIDLLRREQTVKSKHKLAALNPFLDSDNLLRVGGRLKHSFLHFNTKHPFLLNGKHKLCKLIFQAEHIRLLHAGPQLLLSSVRQQFWPTTGLTVAKSVVRQCIKCFRFKPQVINPIMADLPAARVRKSSPFVYTGIDYAGPFTLKDRKGRGCKTYKAYLCLFICFASKAVHLELVTDLTTERFIATLRRFCSRRGTPTHLYSDNATNFIGAQREIKILYKFLATSHDEIVRYCSSEGIIWHFIPPNSPNFGGLWEANIKGVKYHLLRIIADTLLTYEEFNTLLVQIEAILNSRPLHPLSNDPNDIEPLTPAHFLIGRPLTLLPEPEFKDNIRLSQLTRLQLIQQMNKGFWKHWSNLYLQHLQQRQKWQTHSDTLQPGQLVIIKHDNLPPSKWLLGRVLEVHPGSDKVVRVVTLKTANGVLKRAISKVCPLPKCDNELIIDRSTIDQKGEYGGKIQPQCGGI